MWQLKYSCEFYLESCFCAWTIIKTLANNGSKPPVQISYSFSKLVVVINKFLRIVVKKEF